MGSKMNASLCETCPIAGSCGASEISDLAPLGRRRIGNYVEPSTQAVLGSSEGFSHAFYLGHNSTKNVANIYDTLDMLKSRVSNCIGPLASKKRTFLGLEVLAASVECGAIHSGYTLDRDGRPAMLFTEEELRGPLSKIVMAHFVMPLQLK